MGEVIALIRLMPDGVLSDNEIVTLAAYCKKIENHYKFPQDIEWASEKGRLYILQTR